MLQPSYVDSGAVAAFVACCLSFSGCCHVCLDASAEGICHLVSLSRLIGPWRGISSLWGAVVVTGVVVVVDRGLSLFGAYFLVSRDAWFVTVFVVFSVLDVALFLDF